MSKQSEYSIPCYRITLRLCLKVSDINVSWKMFTDISEMSEEI